MNGSCRRPRLAQQGLGFRDAGAAIQKLNDMGQSAYSSGFLPLIPARGLPGIPGNAAT